MTFPILLDIFPRVAYYLSMSYRKTHGPAVRAIREALGLRHGVFAVQCEITPGYLTNIEKGIKQPSPAVAAAIANRLGVPLDAIQYTVEDVA